MASHEPVRPDPESLLTAAGREGKGRLKIFLGAAPGVGKTWAMLNAACRRRDDGEDVLAGVVETHGRAETEAQIRDLPVLPRRLVPYRGKTLEEFDLDAALARHPGLLLVDELAHTNAFGSRHHKRWEDVTELLDAGIDVWATLNIQHLESLNDSIARITGVRVVETLPDRILEMADEIEFIDLTPAELRLRLQEGRIYRPDVTRRALEGFFREGNLAALREIGLRQTAQRVDRDVRDYMRQKAIIGPWPAGDCVLALVGADTAAETVVRAAKRLAEALHAPWIAVHIERPGTAGDTRHAMEMAVQLGALVEIRAGTDVVRSVLALAAERNVTHVVIGRSASSFWRRGLHRTLAQRLINHGSDLVLHVLPTAEPAPPRRRPARSDTVGWLPWLAATLLVGCIVLAGEVLVGTLEHETLGMLFMAVVVASATLWGLSIALYAAALGFLCWNVLFIPPLYSLTITNPRDIIGLAVFAGIAITSGWLASRVRLEARVAQGRIENLRRITGFSRRLSIAATETELLQEVARLAAEVAGSAVVMTMQDDNLPIQGASGTPEPMDDGSRAAARWAWEHQEATGRGTSTLPSSAWRFMPMGTERGIVALLGIHPGSAATLEQPQLQALSTLTDQAAVTLDRIRLANAAARTEAQAETQRLRTALLNSLSHDLRTPLTGIRGAAGSLRLSWDRLSADARDDLLCSIEDDTVRMTGFLANITNMIRLESGEIRPRRLQVRAADVIEAAVARVPDIALLAAVNVPENLTDLSVDPDLLEQALVNVLENAAKYAPVNTMIRIGAQRTQTGVRISIADEGIGIPPDDLAHVFDSFYRAKRGDRTVAGTGLGLAIARGLIEAMNGSISARSPRPDAPRDGAPGTIVDIDLPVAA